MTAWVTKVYPATSVPVIDLHVLRGSGPAAVDQPFILDATEDFVELSLADFERVVPCLECFLVVKNRASATGSVYESGRSAPAGFHT